MFAREGQSAGKRPVNQRGAAVPGGRRPAPAEPSSVDRDAGALDFRILGPFEVQMGGHQLALGGAKQRALLASLVLHANEVVSRDRLLHELWGEDPPETAPKMIQIYVSRLRKILEQGAATRALVTQPPGYVLRVDPENIDAYRFERLVAEGRQALTADDPSKATRTLGEALALWRGSPLAEFMTEPFTETEGGRLEELRLTAVEDRIEAELALGRHADLVGELEVLAAEHPLRERLRAHLMLALYRSGRQAEALDVFKGTRLHLVEVLGIEPSRSLHALQKAILLQEPELDLPTQPSALPASEATATTGAAARTPGSRKPVAVLMAEVIRVGERLDPEAAGRVMSRALALGAKTVERHGATVETPAGGGILAVFGVPTVSEDDALRALHAAVELRGAIEALSTEIERTWRVRLAVRAAVGAGEVVTEETDGHASVIGGEPIDVAGRLVRVAERSEILIDAETERLVRHGAVVERLERAPASEGEPVTAAWRVTRFLPGASAIARRLDTPMVGRERELIGLIESFERVVDENSAFLCTVVGSAGIGKTRLAEELRATLADEATVLVGRCVSFGAGTFSPLAEVVARAAGECSVEAIAALVSTEPEGELIADTVARALGLQEAAGTKEETFWALRKLFGVLAGERPLVLVLDELHWAEPTFLELVEHVVDWSGDAPIFVVGLARPDLLEDRPSWGGGRPNSTILRLRPLSADESDLLLDALLGDGALSKNARARIVAAAEGNPLFIEQMLAMLSEEGEVGDGEPSIPPTIQALLAARVDRLALAERAVLERAAVVGREFWRGAVGELTPEDERGEVDAHLQALIGKELIASARAPLRQEDGFVFLHVLIRETVYDSIPKQARADLHEDVASLLERAAAERPGEHDEAVGSHLERAYRYREELGLLEKSDHELAVRAAEKLAAAGRRAYALGDLPGTVRLLSRGASLHPTSGARSEILTDLGEALRETGDFGRARGVLHEAIEAASAAGDAAAEAHARLIDLRVRAQIDPTVTPDEFDRFGAEAIALFEEAGDERRLAKAWFIRAWGPWVQGRVTDAESALRRAIACARGAGDERTEAQSVNLYVGAGFFGPSPVAEAIRRCEEVIARPPEQRRITAPAFRALAGLRAMEGKFAEARRLARRDRDILEDLGLRVAAAMATEVYGLIEMLADDPIAAERQLRTGYETLEEMGETSILSNLAAMLAQALHAQGRNDEALRYSEISERAASRDDVSPQVQWRAVRAKVLAEEHPTEGRQLAEEAVALAREASDFPLLLADALADLGEVLRLSGRPGDARSALEEGLALYDQKGNAVFAAKAREALASLDAEISAGTRTS
jgi:DNA-binding SARP family transcriptional activator/tetratricopeptide (TPR) repeat protein